jgi:hypothetical protein
MKNVKKGTENISCWFCCCCLWSLSWRDAANQPLKPTLRESHRLFRYERVAGGDQQSKQHANGCSKGLTRRWTARFIRSSSTVNLGAMYELGFEDGGDYGTGNGFLDKQCTTYDSLVMLLSEITSGEKAFGYFSCELGEATTVTKSDVATVLCRRTTIDMRSFQQRFSQYEKLYCSQ